MANSKSAEKRIRSSERKRRINKRIKSLLKMREKLFLKEIQKKPAAAVKPGAGDKAAGGGAKIGEKSLSLLFSIIDKAKKRGVLHKNAADRKKSRLSRKAAKIQKQTAQKQAAEAAPTSSSSPPPPQK